MKKILLLLVALCTIVLSSCEKEEPYDTGKFPGIQAPNDQENPNGQGSQNGQEGQNGQGGQNGHNAGTSTITKLYAVVMRRELPYPFKAYVMQIDNRNYYYMMRSRFNQDLHVGDRISFTVLSFCPNEISSINGIDLGNGSAAEENSSTAAGEYLVASDPIEATVKGLFVMSIRYTITFWPIETVFIETTDGNLVFIKRSKLNVDLRIGDRFVYNVYTLFPNEILALKKL